MSKATIKDVEAAILKAVEDDASISAYVKKEQVQTVSERNVNFATEEIIIVAPAVLVMYMGGAYDSQTVQLKKYRAEYRFLLLAVVQNLRSAEAAKFGTDTQKGAYDLLEDLKQLFAGKQLALPAPARALTRLVGDSLEGIGPDRKFVYGLEIMTTATIWDAAG